MGESGKPQWSRLGREIRRLRLQRGMTQQQLGKSLAVSYAMISAMERGIRGARQEHVEQIDHVFSTGGALMRMWEKLGAGNGGFPDWFQGIVELEQRAREIKTAQPLLIHGLLQTSEYARTVLRDGRPTDTDSEIDGLLDARMKRQAILAGDRPPALLMVIDETALRRPVGSRDIMKVQLERLLEATTHSQTVIQIIPRSTENNPTLNGPFTLLSTKETEVLYLDTPLSGTVVETPEVIGRYERIFGDIRGVALPPRTSRELIEAARGEFA